MTNTSLDTSARSGHLRCGCCGQSLPARRVSELMETPGVYICSGCARWAARRTSRLSGLRRAARRVGHDAVGLVAGGRGGTFRSAIPILPSSDLQRTAAFWATVGFEVVERFDGYVVTHADGVELHFTANRPGGLSGGEVSWQPGQAFVHVKDALALWKSLRSADVAGLGPVEERDYGLREFVVIDPDGNRVRFGSPLPTKQGPA